jgi:hypothetical protein
MTEHNHCYHLYAYPSAQPHYVVICCHCNDRQMPMHVQVIEHGEYANYGRLPVVAAPDERGTP